MIRDEILKSPHIRASQQKRRRALLNKFLYFFGLLLVVFLALGFLSRLEKINIKNIEVKGNKVADSYAVQEAVRNEISGHYFWLYPKSNLLFYSKKGIEKALREEFKIFNEIDLNLKANRSLLVSVSEREPKYTWCGTGLPRNIDDLKAGDCYFMDDTGYIFAVAPYFSGDVYFRFFGTPTGESVLGSNFMPDIFNNLAEFVESLKQMDLNPAVMVDQGEKIEIYLSGASNPPNSPRIVFDRNFDPLKTAENLQAALTTEPFKTDFTEKYSSLIYIDLSFGNKVYYRFTNE